MSKKCKIIVNINGVPREIEDSFLETENLDEALSIIYDNEDFFNLITDNELRKSKNPLNGFNKSLTDEQLVKSGVQGNFSFNSLINLYHNSDDNLLAWINKMNELGINVSDSNILVTDENNSSQSIIQSENRMFFIMSSRISKDVGIIKKLLLSLYIDSKKNSNYFDEAYSIWKNNKELTERYPEINEYSPTEFLELLNELPSVKKYFIQEGYYDDIAKLINKDLSGYKTENILKKEKNQSDIYIGPFKNHLTVDDHMRSKATGFVGELNNDINKKSSTYKSLDFIESKVYTDSEINSEYVASVLDDVDSNSIIMLARNGSLKGQELKLSTKEIIKDLADANVNFIIGNMDGVDNYFIDYLNEIGANYEVYYTKDNAPKIEYESIEKINSLMNVNKINSDTFKFTYNGESVEFKSNATNIIDFLGEIYSDNRDNLIKTYNMLKTDPITIMGFINDLKCKQ